jgi:protein-L-isoaspartate(D-aspartate) O-methyltransferase
MNMLNQKPELKSPARCLCSLVLLLLLLTITGLTTNMKAQNWVQMREKMVSEQMRGRDIRSASVLNAMREVPRHHFVPEQYQQLAYDDRPLPIGWEQTISQPYMVAFMTEQLQIKPGMKILEIGTGSGYQAAVLAHLGCLVYSIEVIPELANKARQVLQQLNYNNVEVLTGNGYLGWEEHAPYDAIIVTAAPEEIPQVLIDQLKEGGTMVIPIGGVNELQYLKMVYKQNGQISSQSLMPVRFVPMVNEPSAE